MEHHFRFHKGSILAFWCEVFQDLRTQGLSVGMASRDATFHTGFYFGGVFPDEYLREVLLKARL